MTTSLTPERVRLLGMMDIGRDYSPNELATLVGSTANNISQMLPKLEKAAYIERTRYGRYKLVYRPLETESTDPVTKDSAVYVIRCDRYYKIGRSDNLRDRVRTLQTALPFDVYLVRSFQVDDPSMFEMQLHKRYREKWVRGEWFELDIFDVEELLTLSSEELR